MLIAGVQSSSSGGKTRKSATPSRRRRRGKRFCIAPVCQMYLRTNVGQNVGRIVPQMRCWREPKEQLYSLPLFYACRDVFSNSQHRVYLHAGIHKRLHTGQKNRTMQKPFTHVEIRVIIYLYRGHDHESERIKATAAKKRLLPLPAREPT